MAKAKKKPDPSEEDLDLGQLIDWVNEADDATTDSRERSEKCRDYYDGAQYTEDELRVFKKQKQAPIVVNRIKPKMDGLMGMERSNRTTAKAYPRTPKHEKDAQSATEAVRFVLQDNFYNQVRSGAWDNMLLEGTGGVEVDVKARGEDGFDIILNHIPWDRIIYDPHSRRRDLTDARYRGQVVWLDQDIALERFPDAGDVIESMINGSGTYDDKPRWMDSKRRRVKIVELYYQQGGEIWYACFTRGGFLKEPKKSAYVNEIGETEDPYEFGSLFLDREGNRYGAALQYLDVQDEINKRRSKALHLMSVRQVRGERGAVDDVNAARAELAKPDGYIETTPGMEFEILKTGDMAQAQFKLLEDAKLEIDAVGYSAAAAGKEERLMSGVALRNREAASQTELAPMFDVLKHMDVRVYRKIWNRIKQYWKEEMWLRVTDDPANVRWLALNRRMTKGQLALETAKGQGLPPEQMAQLEQQIATDPAAQEMVTQNDIAALDVDIVMDDAPDSVTVQQEEFTALSEMVKSGIPIPASAIVESSSLKNKDKILKEMKATQIDPKQVEKMQEEMQGLQEENQALKSDQQTEAAKLQLQAQAQERDMQMKMRQMEQEAVLAEKEFALKAQAQERELQLAREKAIAEIQLKKMQSDADVEIQSEKNKMDFAAQKEKQTFDEDSRRREMDFDQKAQMAEKMPDADFRALYDAQLDQAKMVPQLMQSLEGFMEKLLSAQQDILSGQQQMIGLQRETIAAFERPKNVMLGQIQKDANGQIIGANVATSLN